MIISKGTNSEAGFHIWISKLEFKGLFIFGALTIRVDLIEMTLEQFEQNHNLYLRASKMHITARNKY